MFAGIRAQVPMLAAIQNMLPILALPFSIILLGVFTTITGCLWAIGRRFAEDRAKKQAIIVVSVAVPGAVSYTHLDVYKRQPIAGAKAPAMAENEVK